MVGFLFFPKAGASVLNTVILMDIKPNENWIFIQTKGIDFFFQDETC